MAIRPALLAQDSGTNELDRNRQKTRCQADADGRRQPVWPVQSRRIRCPARCCRRSASSRSTAIRSRSGWASSASFRPTRCSPSSIARSPRGTPRIRRRRCSRRCTHRGRRVRWHRAPSGKYRTRMDSALIEKVYGWAQQTKRAALSRRPGRAGHTPGGASATREISKAARRPPRHRSRVLDEARRNVPGTKIGTFDARTSTTRRAFCSDLVTAESLPPKVLVVHRFTRDMLTGYKRIELDPRVQIVINMDGWGPPWIKSESYRAYVHAIRWSTRDSSSSTRTTRKKGGELMSPARGARAQSQAVLHPVSVVAGCSGCLATGCLSAPLTSNQRPATSNFERPPSVLQTNVLGTRRLSL